MPSLLTELRRRNVLRVAAAYALVAWIIIEAGSVLLPTFGASEATFQLYVILVLLGFLVSLVFAWVFEITPDGVKLEKDVDRTVEPVQKPRGLTNYVIIGLLGIALMVSITFNVTDIRDASEPTAAEIMQDRRSIAILPFQSRSTDPENALFADGVHDDLLTKLANIGSMKVISRTSVMEYRDTTKNLRDIGNELDVDTLLEGTVQRVGTTVRINVQLIDAETDEHLWARIYDREVTVENLFTVQSEVSGEIAAALNATLTPAEQLTAVEVPTESLRAYSLYQSGRDNLHLRRMDSLTEAKAQFEEAIELDPNYAEAYVALAETIIVLWSNFQLTSNEETFEQAETLLQQAAELKPDLSDTYATLGLLKLSVWSTTRLGTENLEAESAFEQALALNPSNARAYNWFAILRDRENKTDEAIGYYHRSMQLDPLGRIPYNNLPGLYAQRGENEYAIKLWLDAIALHPDWPVPYQLMTVQLAALGRLDEAIAWQRLASEIGLPTDQVNILEIGIYAEFDDLERAKLLIDNMPSSQPVNALREGFRLMFDENYEAANEYMISVLESDDDLPVFLYGIASDVALFAGDLETARNYMFVQNPVMQLDTEVEINRFTTRDAIKLAYILKQEGDIERSTSLLNDTLPVVQSLPRLGIYGQGIRDVQVYALLGQVEDALSALREAVDAGYRSSVVPDQWLLRNDPYLAILHGDDRFQDIVEEIAAMNDQMFQRVLDAEASGNWQALTDIAGTI